MSVSTSSQTLHVGGVETPLGPVWIAASARGVRAVTVPGGSRASCLAAARARPADPVVVGGTLVEAAAAELTTYFAGRRRDFTCDLDLVGTPFQRRVWAAVRAVPYGETATYREIAERIGAPRAYRAVGAANGANPVAIVVPCHRLVGSDGSLTGYGGGLAAKRWLLELEAGVGGARRILHIPVAIHQPKPQTPDVAHPSVRPAASDLFRW